MNLLIYDNGLSDVDIIKASLNANTTTDLSAGNIVRVGFMFKNRGLSRVPFFLKNSRYNKYTYFTDACINFLTSKNIKTVDLITCSFDTALFAQEAKDIYTDLGITINYSIDKTGNIAGGNWIMECSNGSTSNINVKDLYFTDKILEYPFDLDILDLIEYLSSVNAVEINDLGNGSTLYKLKKSVTIDISKNYYISNLVNNDIFDGNNHKIKVINESLWGLFYINEIDDNFPLIKNLNVESYAIHNSGIILSTSNNFKVKNCTSKGIIQGANGTQCNAISIYGSGGIIGYGCQNFTVENCKNYGQITEMSGGICGYGCQNFIIKHCKNYGDITGLFAGGIIGSSYLNYSTTYNQSNIIKYCKNYGEIYGEGAGGIIGGGSGTIYNTSDEITLTITIEKCINKGNIKGIDCGGISGYGTAYIGQPSLYSSTSTDHQGGHTSTVTIDDCKNYGTISAEGGGICGGCSCFIDNNNYYECTSTLNIYHCKNYGEVLTNGGGIIGKYTGSYDSNNSGQNNVINANVRHSKVYNAIKENSGGVFGSDVGINLDQATENRDVINISIEKCKIYGLTDKTSGAFLGSNSTADILTITGNSYNAKDKPYVSILDGTNLIYTNNISHKY